jgi:hypothetical protein
MDIQTLGVPWSVLDAASDLHDAITVEALLLHNPT